MSLASSSTVNVLVPVGSLGAGVREREVAYGIAQGAHVIACDAGSTDSGAAYLAKGMSKNNRDAVKRDLLILMKAQAKAGIPIVVGTCGQAGGDLNVDWTRDIALEIANEHGMKPRIALLYSEQSKEAVKAMNAAGKIRPLPPLGVLNDATIDECDHIVAAMGVEPFIAALQSGADIILAGRSTDTAVLASYPIWKGAPWGPAWHAGKTGECGGQCTRNPMETSGVLMRVGSTGFVVEPLSATTVCDPHSVSAHMLYENSDPFRLIEPGGVLDVSDVRYVQKDERSVEVTGSRWEKKPYTLKLEGAGGGKYQTVMLVGIQDPDVLNDVEGFHDRLLSTLHKRTRRSIPHDVLGDYHISLRMYGWNGLTGEKVPPDTSPPREIAVMFVATASTQDLANQIAKACNAYFFHFPSVPNKELPSYGFPFTPAEIPRGQVYEFKLNHVAEVDDPLALTRTVWLDLSTGEEKRQ
jgi:hypothetical protein